MTATEGGGTGSSAYGAVFTAGLGAAGGRAFIWFLRDRQCAEGYRTPHQNGCRHLLPCTHAVS